MELKTCSQPTSSTMSHKRLTANQLWQFLCPALNFQTPKRHISTVSTKRRPRCSSVPLETTPRCLRIPKSSISAHSIHQQSHPKQGHTGAPPRQLKHGRIAPSKEAQRLNEKSAKFREIVAAPENRPTESLENALLSFAKNFRDPEGVMQILQVLIRDRKIEPKARHYQALMLCNTNPQKGSSAVARDLLAEMEELRIPLNSDILHAALEVGFADCWMCLDCADLLVLGTSCTSG